MTPGQDDHAAEHHAQATAAMNAPEQPVRTKHVFDGPTDGRQQASTTAPVSRFRPTYRALTDEEKALHDNIKTQAAILEDLIDQVKGRSPGRYKSLAITSLEESIMWAVKELTG